MARCLNCGVSAQAECARCLPCDDIPLEDIVEVLAFLCFDLGFHAQLSVDNLLFSVQAVTVKAASDQQYVLPSRYPTAEAKALRQLLRAFLPARAPPAEYWLDSARLLSPGNLYLQLKRHGLQGRIFPLLALYSKAHHPRSGSEYREFFQEAMAASEPQTAGWVPAFADESSEEEDDSIEWQPGFLSPCLECPSPPPTLGGLQRKGASTGGPQELWMLARLIHIERSANPCISPLGHSSLQSYGAKRRILKAVHITPKASRRLAQLILCHELVHVALWFSEPYRRCGGCHPFEEVICHAAMRLFAYKLAPKCKAHDLQVIQHRIAVCDKDASTRSTKLYQQALLLFQKRQTDSLLSYFFQLTHA